MPSWVFVFLQSLFSKAETSKAASDNVVWGT